MSRSSSTPQLKDRKRAAAEASLLEAAAAELAAGTLTSVSMQAIATRAGVSVGTLYNYFQDKNALLDGLMTARRRAFVAHLDTSLDAHGPFPAQVRALVLALFTYFDAHRDVLRVLLNPDSTPLKRKSASSVIQERVRLLLERGVKEGAVRRDAVPLATVAVGGIIRAILLDRVAGREPFVDIVDDVVALILRGVSS